MAKYLLIAAIVISLATAGIGFVNHGTLVETKETLQQTETKLGATQKTLTDTTGKLKETTATLEATESEKTKLAADLTSAQSELDSTKTQLTSATEESASKDAKIADLEDQVEKFRVAAGGNGGGDNVNIEETIAQFNQRIQELEASLSSAQSQVRTAQEELAVVKKRESDRQDRVAKQGLEGRVLAVNPAWNFVVLSIGDKQGVVNNSEMLLKRGGQFLGKVRVTSVEPSTSIADIVANTLPSGVAVQPGDSVIYQSLSE